MKTTTKRYVLTGETPLLGSQSPNPEIRTAYIASKAPDALTAASEDGLLSAETMNEKSLTVFLRQPDSGQLMVLDYTIRGFIKESLATLSSQLGIAQPKSKVDRYLFVTPRDLLICRPEGDAVLEPDGIFERPLRAMTMQGPRVTLIGSEQVDRWQICLDMTLLDNPSSPKSKALSWDAVEEALDYGQFQGLGQFRNGSFGRFIWDEI
jgi:hypothetical protein